jgi:AT hook motif
MARTRGRGRPPKSAGLRRTRRLPVLLTPAEHAGLVRYCKRRNISASGLVRRCLKRFLEFGESKAPSGGRLNKGDKR